tara:strand:- start:399 stop:641 length:243 start_codon:yes stop_codon:yes gene_type:complete
MYLLAYDKGNNTNDDHDDPHDYFLSIHRLLIFGLAGFATQRKSRAVFKGWLCFSIPSIPNPRFSYSSIKYWALAIFSGYP